MSAPEVFEILIQGLWLTLLVTFAALALGLVLGVPIALARNSSLVMLRAVAIAYIEIFRGIPPLVWLFIVFFGLPRTGLVEWSAATSAIVALGIVSSAYMAEIYRAGIESVDRGQWESANALGIPDRVVFIRVIAPQALILVVPPAAAYAVGLLKDSALASIIGVQEVTFRAYVLTQRTFEGLQVFLVAAAIYVLISIPMAVLSRGLDRRLTAYLGRATE